MSKRKSAVTTATIYGSERAWSLSPLSTDSEGRCVLVEVEIVGSQRQGFHLVLSPAGFLTADTWHLEESEALESMKELFGTLVLD